MAPVDGRLSSGMVDRHGGPAGNGEVGDVGDTDLDSTDLDAPPRARPTPPAARRPAARRGRRCRWGAAAAVAAAALVLVVVQHARGGGGATDAGLVAVGGSLGEVARPTSADNNTRAVLRVELRNDAAAPVTLLALRPTGEAGSLMHDDLRSSGAESMGVESGLTLRPGRRVTVTLTGVVRCAGARGVPAVAGDLGARVRGADGGRARPGGARPERPLVDHRPGAGVRARPSPLSGPARPAGARARSPGREEGG